jgi:hypothetical protein
MKKPIFLLLFIFSVIFISDIKAETITGFTTEFNSVLLVSLIIGYLTRVFINTKKAVKSKTNTPQNFDFIFYLKDNLFKKISTIVTFIVGMPQYQKLTVFAGTKTGKIVLIIFSFIVGLMIDIIYSKIQSKTRNTKIIKRRKSKLPK